MGDITAASDIVLKVCIIHIIKAAYVVDYLCIKL